MRVRECNKELIKVAGAVVDLPLNSVRTAFNVLSDMIAPHRAKAEIVIIPMGPKPHVLAAMLVAMRFEEVACLRVSAKRRNPEEVEATGRVIGTRVHFKTLR